MKKIFLTTTSLIILSSAAAAADLPTKKAPLAPPPPTWTGFYAGLNLGGGWGADSGYSNVWQVIPINASSATLYNITAPNYVKGGVLGGGQIGYNYQLSPMFVVGAEADIQGSTMGSGGSNQYALLTTITQTNNNASLGYIVGPTGGQKSIPWFGTVRGRVGVTPMSNLLIYGTAGFGYGSVQYSSGGAQSTTQVGWSAGGGVEWMFMRNWSAKAEYLYMNIAGQNTDPWGVTGAQVTNINNNTRWNLVRAGVNYHFNLDEPAPINAKY
jgi:outer membrane immunogenic protein